MRRLVDAVPEAPLLPNGTEPYSESDGGADDNYFNTSLLVILATLLCTLICVLGLNSIIRCAIRCSRRRHFAFGTPEAAVATGLKKRAIRHIPIVVYGPEATVTATTECAICLTGFANGEKIRVLPECYHAFHVRCIDTWLALQSTCPTCRHSLLLDKAGPEAGDRFPPPDDGVALRRGELTARVAN
ncbi:RING-H2 finger protein ATL74-like [Musa acuminata AAA Group]|uniref:RING-H2 finger protein ATL74-like n=1 Tax=Musa acuminata AAA Group TaxID=214697 RepID=UPI0031E42FF8